jgi:hypothetical protein
MAGGSGRLYRVVYSESIQRSLVRTHRRALARGRGDEVIAAAKAIDTHLRTDPWAFGEPRYHLLELRLAVRIGVHAPLAVWYAVHLDKPVVFVKTILALPSSGL